MDDTTPRPPTTFSSDTRPTDVLAGGPRYRLRAFLSGARIIGQVPALILAATGAGFGALAKDAGLGLAFATTMSVVLYATPAQVAFIDGLQRGAPLIVVALAVMLTGIRFLPMTVSLVPYLRGPGVPRWQFYVAAHFVAITGWSEAVRRLPPLPPPVRMPYFLGLGSALMTALSIGTVVGHLLAGWVPVIVMSALLFMMPIYFLVSQIMNAHRALDLWAIGLGATLGPLFLMLAPGVDLLLTGLIGGTAAFVLGRRRTRAEPGP
jgi:predicted branched-subunit amino acid permease